MSLEKLNQILDNYDILTAEDNSQKWEAFCEAETIEFLRDSVSPMLQEQTTAIREHGHKIDCEVNKCNISITFFPKKLERRQWFGIYLVKGGGIITSAQLIDRACHKHTLDMGDGDSLSLEGILENFLFFVQESFALLEKKEL